jgi:Ca-activated chloride channel family protein
VEEFLITAKTDQPNVLTGDAETELYGLFTIRPNPAVLKGLLEGAAPGLPTHLVLVLDVSGSMNTLIRDDPHARVVKDVVVEGVRMREVETNVPSRKKVVAEVARRIVRRLGPEDAISIVAFDHSVYELASRVSGAAPRAALDAIDRLAEEGGGGTQLKLGLERARRLIAATPVGHTRKIVVLTDGEDQAAEEAIEVAKTLVAEHAVVDALGCGDEYRHDFLFAVTKPTGGLSHKINDEQDAERVFDQIFTGQKDILATGVELALWVTPEVHVADVYRTKPDILFLGDVAPGKDDTIRVPIENMLRGKVYEFLVKVVVPKRPPGARVRLVRATLRYDIPTLKMSRAEAVANLAVTYTEDAALANERDGEVRHVFNQAEVQRQLLFLAEKRQAIEKGTASDKDRRAVAKLIAKIIEKYQRMGDQANVNLYEKMRDEYERGGKISQDMLNASLAASSRAEDGAVSKPEMLDF